MDIAFRGEVTKEEFIRAVRMTLRLSERETRIRVAGAIAVAVVIIAAIVYDQIVNGYSVSRIISMVLSMLMIELVFLLPFINILETEFRIGKSLLPRSFLAGAVSSRGIMIESQPDNWERAWNDFYRMRQSEDLLGLKAPDGRIWVLSRRLFASESDWKTVKTWAQNLVLEAK